MRWGKMRDVKGTNVRSTGDAKGVSIHEGKHNIRMITGVGG